jgi:hypothetical protein
VYEPQLAVLRAAFGAVGTANVETVRVQVQKIVDENGWTEGFVASLTDLLTLASKHNVSINALDNAEWSQDAFVQKQVLFNMQMLVSAGLGLGV